MYIMFNRFKLFLCIGTFMKPINFKFHTIIDVSIPHDYYRIYN